MSKGMVLCLAGVLLLGSGCAAMSDFFGQPMGEYRADQELRLYYLNKTAVVRGDVLDAKTGEMVFPAGTQVTVTDIRFRPNRFPRATGLVEIVDATGTKFKLGLTARFKEHFLLELNEVLVLNAPRPAEALPWGVTPAEAHAVKIGLFVEEFASRPLWLVRDVPCVEGSKRSFLPARTEVALVDGSVVVSEGVSGRTITRRVYLSDGEGSTVAVFLDVPMRSYTEWYNQLGEVVTADACVLAPDGLPAGTSREDVVAAWGAPDRRRGELSNDGVKEVWTYALRGETLTFVDGKLAGR
ncbi:MAG: hypothetical protein KAW17_00080 [Candidatus Eisenbacteria sp.]|nr:hypothetical protein [Candidatus Eisenbacteria bacterium]